jgi:hypothetical protein
MAHRPVCFIAYIYVSTCWGSLPPAVNLYRSCVRLGWFAQETIGLDWFKPQRSNTLRPVSSCRVPELGVFVVAVTNWSGEGVDPGPLKWCSIFRRSNPCNGCPPLPFIVTRGGAQGGSEKMYSARLLGCPVACRCRSERIKVESSYLVVGAATWPGVVVQPGTPGISSE